MQARGLLPSQAYSTVEKGLSPLFQMRDPDLPFILALPLFNPTKSFLKQLELFHSCQFNPTSFPRPHSDLYRRYIGIASQTIAIHRRSPKYHETHRRPNESSLKKVATPNILFSTQTTTLTSSAAHSQRPCAQVPSPQTSVSLPSTAASPPSLNMPVSPGLAGRPARFIRSIGKALQMDREASMMLRSFCIGARVLETRASYSMWRHSEGHFAVLLNHGKIPASVISFCCNPTFTIYFRFRLSSSCTVFVEPSMLCAFTFSFAVAWSFEAPHKS